MFIIAKKCGRLGNRLFIAAHIMSCAIEHNHDVMYPAFPEYAKYFPTTHDDLLCRFPPRKSFIRGFTPLRHLVYYAILWCSTFLWLFRISGTLLKNVMVVTAKTNTPNDAIYIDQPEFSARLDGKELVFFQGWLFRSPIYLAKHGDKIRPYFSPLEIYQTKIDALITRLRESSDILVGIVIRHTDYRRWQGGKYYYPREKYVEFMEQIEVLFPGKKVCFLICSDEEQNTSDFEKFTYFFRAGHMMENLYSLAECNFMISAPSTYGMWASFYGKVPMYLIYDGDRPIVSLEQFKVAVLE